MLKGDDEGGGLEEDGDSHYGSSSSADEELNEKHRVVGTKKRKRGADESRSSNRQDSWTKEDDLKIIAMKENEKKSWADIAKSFTGRSSTACQSRYSSVLKKGEKRLGWSIDDDTKIIHMKENEKKSWADIAECFTGRSLVACKKRYSSALKEEEKRARVAWSNDDDLRIIEIKENEKKSWVDIAKCFTGRSLTACRNRYHDRLKPAGRVYKGDSESTQEEVLFPTGYVEIDEDGVEIVWL
jgi:hypothetical protein